MSSAETNHRHDPVSYGHAAIREQVIEALQSPPTLAPLPRRKRGRRFARKLLIFLGGAAIKTGSRLKRLMQSLKADSHFEFLAIDTDESSQAGAEGCPGFDDDEFVHINLREIGKIVRNPDTHRAILERMGLADPQQLAFFESMIHDDNDQAGQVRAACDLGVSAAWHLISSAIKRKLAILNSTSYRLEQQLGTEDGNDLKDGLEAWIMFSDCGGSGSGAAPNALALTRALTSHLPTSIKAIVLAPSTFERVMVGKPDQFNRLKSNGYVTLQELHALREGFGSRVNLKLGPDERSQIPVPAGLFNELFIVGRYQANGRELPSAEAVYDSLALGVAAELGTELVDLIALDDSNQATLRELMPDPATGQARYVSTLGATALAFSADRCAQFCAATNLDGFVQRRVLGAQPTAEAAEQSASAWFTRPLPDDALALDPRALTATLRRLVLPNAQHLVRPLFKLVQGSQRLYYRNGEIPDRMHQLLQQFERVQLPALEARVAEFQEVLLKEVGDSLQAQFEQLVVATGHRTAAAFGARLIELLTEDAARLTAEAADDEQRGKRAVVKAKESALKFSTIWRRYWTSGRQQDAVAAHLLDGLSASVDASLKRAAHSVLQDVLTKASQCQDRIVRVLQEIPRCRQNLAVTQQQYRAEQRLTTDSLVEVDISTVKSDAALFARFRLEDDALLARLEARLQKSSRSTLRALAIQPEALEVAMRQVADHFGAAFRNVTAVDLLAGQLADAESQHGALVRIQHVVQACQPLWQADPRNIGVRFADTMIIGIPPGEVPAERERVKAALLTAATSRIHANGQYTGKADAVATSDPHRIYVLRRTHGACLHYLSEVHEGHAAYEEWQRMGGHPLHLFAPEIVANMPSIIPQQRVDDGELAFALGVAYGWIANRGPWWYANLAADALGSNRLVCRLNSHWDGVAFQGQQPTVENGALQTLLGTGRLVYEARDDMVATDRLAQGMENAARAVMQDPQMIELILNTFDELRAAAGDVKVAEEVAGYVASLRKRMRSSDKNFDLVMRMSDTLQRRVGELCRD
ncbi:MAG: tubulin-like doman-containing protein [Pirellulales bacterium]|nr:tubulin-like doman-containing protein [Pirellulales bacterium]